MIDQIIFNGNIHTFDTQNPQVSALAVIGGRIVATGSDAEIIPLAGATTQRVNLNGRFAMPGLVDGHIHWENVAKARGAVDLWQVPSLAEAQRRIQIWAEKLAAGEWIFGGGWAQSLWQDTAGAFPTAAALDAVTGSHPAYFYAKSGHAAWVNSAALQQAGISANTPDPSGGKIGRLADGSPNGILFETPAMQLVAQQIPKPQPEKLADWMCEAQTDAWRFGLVGIHDFDNPSCMAALQLLRERGELGLRVVKQINDPFIENAHALGVRAGFGDDWIRLGALKIFADGALGARTAAMIAPYENEPNNWGVVVTDKEAIYEMVSRASRLGLASSVHAIGDRAVHDVLDVFQTVRQEEAQAGIPRTARRHRIEHVQIIHPDDGQRLGELDIIASMQPIHMSSDWQMAEEYWGERSRHSYQWRRQLDAGARLLFGSDAPIDPYDTLAGIHTAITRRDVRGEPPAGWYPEARLTLSETLHAYTTAPAYAGGMENHSGRLKAGFLADLAVFDCPDLFSIPHDELLGQKIVGTLLDGVWCYRVFD